MADDQLDKRVTGVVAVTKTKQIKRDLLGRVTEERTQVGIVVDVTAPTELIDAAKAISSTAPKIVASAQAAGTAFKNGVKAKLIAPSDKKKR